MRTLRAACVVVVTLAAPACVLYVDEPPDDSVDDEPWTPPDAGIVVDAPPPQLACDVPAWCPTPSNGRVSLCGQLRDVETDVAIRVAGAQGQLCTPGDTTGPCGLDVVPYDALDFAGNPDGAQPLPTEAITIDTCGRFVMHNIQRPQLGFLALGIDDADGAPDARRRSGQAWPVQSGAILDGVTGYAMRRSTDQLWSSTAGLSPGFTDRGVIFAMFRTLNGPVAGVTIQSSNGTSPADDYAFSDPSPVTRSQLDMSMTATGPNGVALMLNSPLVEHTGSGGEPAGCAWDTGLASAIPGVLFVFEVWAERPDGSRCP